MQSVFQAMADYGEPVSVKDVLDEVGQNYDTTFIERVLQWGQEMNLVRRFYPERSSTLELDEADRFQLEHFFADLVRTPD
jgi:hypothetical protein